MARKASKIYVPLDVGFMDDSKVLAAGEKAAWLFLAILLRCKQLDTGGHLTRQQIARLGVDGWPRRLAALVDAGLLAPNGSPDAFIVPAWGKWNETATERAERLEKERRRKAEYAERMRQAASDSERNPNGNGTEST